MSSSKSTEELRIRLRNIFAYQWQDTAYEALDGQIKMSVDQSVEATLQLFDQELAKRVEEAKPAIEIVAKIKALDKIIMGAGEYHDDPYEYVIRLSDARNYRLELSQFDLSEPVFFDKATLNNQSKEKKNG